MALVSQLTNGLPSLSQKQQKESVNMSVQWWKEHTDIQVVFFSAMLLWFLLYNLESKDIWTVNSCSVHTHTHRHTSVKALSGQISLLAYTGGVCLFLILKSYSFIIILFFCKFAKILNPLNAKSEKELLPERCFVVHQALMSKWLSFKESLASDLWSGQGSEERCWTLGEPLNRCSVEQISICWFSNVNIGTCSLVVVLHVEKKWWKDNTC